MQVCIQPLVQRKKTQTCKNITYHNSWAKPVNVTNIHCRENRFYIGYKLIYKGVPLTYLVLTTHWSKMFSMLFLFYKNIS